MPHTIHRIGRSIVQRIPFLPESRVTNLLSRIRAVGDEDVETTLRNGCRMLVNLQEHVGFHIYIRGHYQPHVLKHLQRFLKPGMTMFDIGAHFGLFTLVAARIVRPTGRVHAFEPGPSQWRYLTYNIAANKFEDRVQANHVALGDHEGSIGYVPGEVGNIGASHVTEEGAGTATVPLITLDDYCRRNKVDRIDAIKIDVEGYELRVLQGFKETLSVLKPALIAYECVEKMCRRYGCTAADVHNVFLDLGYRVHKARVGSKVTRHTAHRANRQKDFVARRPD